LAESSSRRSVKGPNEETANMDDDMDMGAVQRIAFQFRIERDGPMMNDAVVVVPPSKPKGKQRETAPPPAAG